MVSSAEANLQLPKVVLTQLAAECENESLDIDVMKNAALHAISLYVPRICCSTNRS